MEKDYEQLQRRIDELEKKLLLLEDQLIKIVGDFDGTNVQVSVNGVRRKIATTAP